MKEIAVIFDRPVILPGDGLVAVETFGFIFPQSELTKPENIRTYTKHYVMVIAQLFKDKTIEFVGKLYYKKTERSSIWTTTNGMSTTRKQRNPVCSLQSLKLKIQMSLTKKGMKIAC